MITAKAKSKIKNSLKDQRKKIAEEGKENMSRKFDRHKLDFSNQIINEFCTYLKLPSSQELFYRAALGNVDVQEIKEFIKFRESPVKKRRKAEAKKNKNKKKKKT